MTDIPEFTDEEINRLDKENRLMEREIKQTSRYFAVIKRHEHLTNKLRYITETLRLFESYKSEKGTAS